LEIDTFWRPFLLNETTCFVQNDIVSLTVHFLKKAKLCRFNSVVHLIFPLDALQAREEGFFSLATPLSLSLAPLL